MVHLGTAPLVARLQAEAKMRDELTPETGDAAAPIAFVEHFATRDTFMDLFQDGMRLVEETAIYLDGQGRTDSKMLSRAVALTYTSESMRLTTRLMQLASWLLLQRAVREGEITSAQASNEKTRVNLAVPMSDTDSLRIETLPASLRELIGRSNRLQQRIRHLDRALNSTTDEAACQAPSVVQQTMGRLMRAFAPEHTDN